ncbi:MAG: hypothetical protein D8M59_08665 [Planctomycetes bacterium]|nr:hypothetical protein [Planctomycetota bacterium]NOG53929.1 hypothetical protein [Planctomycetota bacterium]
MPILTTMALGDEYFWDGHCGSSEWTTICGGEQCGFDPDVFMQYNNWGLSICNVAPPIPGSGDIAYLNSADVLIGSGNISVGGLNLSYDSTLQIDVGYKLYLDGPDHFNDGIIIVNRPNANALSELIGTSDLTILGSGEIVLDKYWADWPVSDLTTINNSTITNGPDHTIGGRGYVLASLYNQGTVAGNMNGYPLKVTEQDKTNAGTFEAVNGGALYIFDQNLTQTSTGRLFGNGATVWLQGGANITGGNLETADGGEILIQQVNQYWAPNALADVTVTPGSNVHVADLSDPLHLRGSTLVNNGTITVNDPDGISTCTLEVESDINVSGTGDILLNKYHQYELANIKTTNGSILTNGNGHTIHGIGHIQGIIENQGLITADVPGGTLHLLQDDKTNAYVMQAENGGSLLIDGIAVTQTSAGQLMADGGTVVLQNGAAVTLGALNTANGGAVEVRGGNAGLVVLTDVSVAPGAEIHIEGQSYPTETWLRLENSLINDGIITIDYSNNNGKAHIEVPNDVAVTGSGEIVLNRWHQYELATIQTSPGATLTNDVHHTIRGIGHIRASIANYGILGTDTPGHRIDLYPGTEGVANYGLLQVAEDSQLHLYDAGMFTQAADGRVMVNGSLYLYNGGLTMDGGTLYGIGIINGNVNNVGAMCEPGIDEGKLIITGNYDQASAATLHMEAAGRSAGEYDVLAVSGHATFDGALDLEAIDGFEPQPGDRFEVMTYSSHTGQFSEYDLPPLPSRRYVWRIDYGANVLAIEYVDRLKQGGSGGHKDPIGAQRIGG